MFFKKFKFNVGEEAILSLDSEQYRRVIIAQRNSSWFGDDTYSVYWQRTDKDTLNVVSNLREDCLLSLNMFDCRQELNNVDWS